MRQRIGELEPQRDVVGRELPAHQREQVANHGIEIDRFVLALAFAREPPQLTGDVTGALTLGGDLLERVLEPGGLGGARVQQTQAGFGKADDGGQRLVDLVRDARAQLPEGREPRRVRELGAAPARLVLGAAPIGDVADDAGEQPSASDAELADRKVDGKPTAALVKSLDLPADADDAGLAGVEIARDVRVVLGPIRLGHEHADVATGDLVRLVTENRRGHGICRFDDAVLVDDDDRVDGGVQNGLEARLAIGEPLERPLELVRGGWRIRRPFPVLTRLAHDGMSASKGARRRAPAGGPAALRLPALCPSH